jgi:poly[(R)-3-hydroxyalkanoate] polymerase subunit PhaC
LLSVRDGERYVDPETWYATAAKRDGSWWPVWADWLERHASGKAPALGAPDKGYPPVGPAPERYVSEP